MYMMFPNFDPPLKHQPSARISSLPRMSVCGLVLTIGFCRRSVSVVKWPYSSPTEKSEIEGRPSEGQTRRSGGDADFDTSLYSNFS